MVAVFLIVFREVLEVGLVVGIVLAATRGVSGRNWWIAAGIVAGIAGAMVVAALADRLGNRFSQADRQVMDAAILAVAVAMLSWTVVWLSAHGQRMAAALARMSHDIAEGRKPLKVLAMVVGVAVLREGLEVVLFVYGTVAAGKLTTLAVASGIGLGILYGAATAGALYLGLGAIPLRHVFTIMSILITLLASGLAAQAVGLLQSAGYLAMWSEPAWDTSHILRQGSIVGLVLHTLVGYLQRPTALQILAYGTTIVTIVGAICLANRTRVHR